MNVLSQNLPDMSVLRQPLAIERRESPTRAEFEQQYLSKPGTPVILTDVAKRWPAFEKWTFDFFARKFGDEEVTVSDRLLRSTKTCRMKLSMFLRYCQSQESPIFEALGKSPLYFGFQPFAQHPELLDDFSQPAVADSVYEDLTGELYNWYVKYFGVILIGSPGTVTPLHADLFGTHGWLAQICGRKHWLVFAPEDGKNLHNGNVDLMQPDLAASPSLRNAQPYEAVVNPGEVVFVPQGWYHHVVALDPSISFGFNFVNQTNFTAHVLGICRDLPRWMQRIKSPEFRDQLSISWTAADFEVPKSSDRTG